MHPLDAIAEPRRREILRRIAAAGEIGVSEIAETLPVSRPAVSQHLRILQDARIVRHRKVGRSRLYRIDPEGVHVARAAIEVFLVSELDDLESAARRLQREPTPTPLPPSKDAEHV